MAFACGDSLGVPKTWGINAVLIRGDQFDHRDKGLFSQNQGVERFGRLHQGLAVRRFQPKLPLCFGAPVLLSEPVFKNCACKVHR